MGFLTEFDFLSALANPISTITVLIVAIAGLIGAFAALIRAFAALIRAVNKTLAVLLPLLSKPVMTSDTRLKKAKNKSK